MSDSSQTWCMVPTEPASDCATEAPAIVDELNAGTMTALTNVAFEGEKDGTYYWDTVKFSVEGVCFKVPRYQFVVGSSYFAGKLQSDKDGDGTPIALEGATASQFRVLLKLLFPIHTTSTTLTFSKDEWLIILELSTIWDFHEFRKLAKEHLENQLDDPIERIAVGRAAYTPRWVLEGYQTLVTRSECISEQESERIGHLTTVRLYVLRHEQCVESGSIASRFREEIQALEQTERHHLCAEERRIDEEKRLEEERERRAREEEQRLAEEKVRVEREEQERKEREETECRERERQERSEERERREAEAKARRRAGEERRKEDEEWTRKEKEKLHKEADDRIHRKEALRLEEERIARELADLEKQAEEARSLEQRLEEQRIARELADLENQEEEARLQEVKEPEEKGKGQEEPSEEKEKKGWQPGQKEKGEEDIFSH
ncbi:hypothetical protein MD484_g470, partial [Candolleomyces efflorescens]